MELLTNDPLLAKTLFSCCPPGPPSEAPGTADPSSSGKPPSASGYRLPYFPTASLIFHSQFLQLPFCNLYLSILILSGT